MPENPTGWNWDCITGGKIVQYSAESTGKTLFILLKGEMNPNNTFTLQSCHSIYVLQGLFSGRLWTSICQKKLLYFTGQKKTTLKHQFYERRRSRVPFWNASLLYDTVLRGHIWVFTIAKHVLSCRHGLNYSSETLLCDDSGGFDAGIKTWDKVAGKYQVNKRTTFRSIQSRKNDTKQWGWGMQWVLNRSTADRHIEVK